MLWSGHEADVQGSDSIEQEVDALLSDGSFLQVLWGLRVQFGGRPHDLCSEDKMGIPAVLACSPA